MKGIHQKIKNNEQITRGDLNRAFHNVSKDLNAVKKNLKKNNPEALESINKILEKIERTQINEAFKGIKRGKILLDVNLKVNRNTLELGQQHRDIKNLGEKVDKDDHDLVKLIRDLGDFIGLGKGEKIKTKITTKQSRMLEVIDLDTSLNYQEQKLLRYMIIKKYDYYKDKFAPVYFNEFSRNAKVKTRDIKLRLNNLIGRGLLETKRHKNKIYYLISHKFFGMEAESVEKSLEEMEI